MENIVTPKMGVLFLTLFATCCVQIQGSACTPASSGTVKFLMPHDFCLQPGLGKFFEAVAGFNQASQDNGWNQMVDVDVLKDVASSGWLSHSLFEESVKKEFGTQRHASPKVYDMTFVFESWFPEIVEGANKAAPDGLVDLSSHVKKSSWYIDLFPVTKYDITSYQGKMYGIPIDLDFMAIMMNKNMSNDALVRGNLPFAEPRTWEELADAVEHWNGKTYKGKTMTGLCYARSGNMREHLKQQIWASLVQTKGPSQGFWFDEDIPAKFTPLFAQAKPAFKHAMKLVRRLLKHAPIGDHPMSSNPKMPEAMHLRLVADRCAFFLGHSPKAMYDTSKCYSTNNTLWGCAKTIDYAVQFKALPPLGTRKVWNRKTAKMEACTSEICPLAQSVLFGGSKKPPFDLSYPSGEYININNAPLLTARWNLAISSHASPEAKTAGLRFIDWLQNTTGSEKSNAMKIMMDNACFDPWTTIHLRPSSAVEYKTKKGATDWYYDNKVHLTVDMMSSPNRALPLRVAGAAGYQHAFDAFAEKYVDGRITETSFDDEVVKLASEFDSISSIENNLYGSPMWQVSLYRKSLNLPPLDQACPAGKFFSNTTFQCTVCPQGLVALAERQVECRPCIGGYFATSASSCSMCEAGKFRSESAGAAVCQNCPPGRFSVDGADRCIPCIPGFIQPAAGSAGCSPCAQGRFREDSHRNRRNHRNHSNVCSACPGSFTTQHIGAAKASDCNICPKDFHLDGAACVSCAPLTTSETGSSSCTVMTEVIVTIIALCCVLVCATMAYFLARRAIHKVNEANMQAELAKGLQSVKDLSFPMVLIDAQSLLEMGLEYLAKLHEQARDDGKLLFLDSADKVSSFKAIGNSIIFFSYQWTSWTRAGANVEQLACMKAAVTKYCMVRELDVEKVFIWLDILCVPQMHKQLKALAVNSLYFYASMAASMIIVCPAGQHEQTNEDVNAASCQSRTWCRTEQLAFYSHQGIDSMYIITDKDNLMPLDCFWMQKVVCVFDGEMTCCRLKHPGGQSCDQQSIVPTLMGLYFDLYAKQAAGKLPEASKEAWGLISGARDKVFPRKFAYIAPSGRVTQRKLFGDMIDRIEHFVNNDPQFALELTSADAAARKNLVQIKLQSDPGKSGSASLFDAEVDIEFAKQTPWRNFQQMQESDLSSLRLIL